MISNHGTSSRGEVVLIQVVNDIANGKLALASSANCDAFIAFKERTKQHCTLQELGKLIFIYKNIATYQKTRNNLPQWISDLFT